MEKTQPYIRAAANRMLKRFGADAVREVEIRITELKEHGEIDAEAFWRRVHEALLQLDRDGADQTKH